jgi:hypothetical protein
MSIINTHFEKQLHELMDKSGGYFCGYCGRKLEETAYGGTNSNTATVDHIIPTSKGGGNDIDNLLLACFSCNALKRNRGVEDLRFYLAMREFKIRTGISFSNAQLRYLKSVGFELDIHWSYFRFELVAEIAGETNG